MHIAQRERRNYSVMQVGMRRDFAQRYCRIGVSQNTFTSMHASKTRCQPLQIDCA